MRSKKAKRLRKFVKENFSNMPERDYVLEHTTAVDNTPRTIIKLIGSCQRRIYKNLKRETRHGVSFA